MTVDELEQLVRLWQRRLGLERWQLTVHGDVETWADLGHELGDESPDATVRHRVKYLHAQLAANPGKLPAWTFAEGSQHVVHELLHLVLRELELVAEPLEQLVHRDAWRVFDDQRDRVLELTVDELARRLVELELELRP